MRHLRAGTAAAALSLVAAFAGQAWAQTSAEATAERPAATAAPAPAPAAPPAAAAATPAPDPAAKPTETSSTTPATPPPAAAPAPTAAPAPETPAPTPAAAEPPPPPPVHPVIAEIRRLLAEPIRGGVDRTDRAALTAFYSERGEPLWTAGDGFAPKARHVMAEIAKADDWGLSASAFELPRLAPGESAPAALADAELKLGFAVLKYARHARGGRLDPSALSRHLDMKLTLREASVVLQAMVASETPGAYLRDLHPKHPQFVRLRQALLKARGGQQTAAPEPSKSEEPTLQRLPDGPALKLGSEHPHVALLRKRLNLPSPRGAEQTFDLQVQDALKEFQGRNNIVASGTLTPRTRAALNAGVPSPKTAKAAPKPKLAGSEVQRLIVNMERWRWMPEDLGEMHIWDNIPEFMSRVYKKGQVIHTAKIIVGKPNTPTAVFSAPMKFLVFHPEWGVPDSIKIKEIGPYLSGGGGFFFFGGDTSILTRQRMRVVYNGRTVDASSVNWGSVDIRRYSFVQSAGPHNVLGIVKFMFPNKHDIYMHDTPQRELFEQQVRLHSHGCIRVHNPGKLAELLLAEDKGWPAERVRAMLAQGYNNEVQLDRQIMVHVTYFTAVAGEDGHVSYFSDPYGHDNRVLAALGGKPLPADIGGGADNEAGGYQEARRPARKQQNATDFFSGLFGN